MLKLPIRRCGRPDACGSFLWRLDDNLACALPKAEVAASIAAVGTAVSVLAWRYGHRCRVESAGGSGTVAYGGDLNPEMSFAQAVTRVSATKGESCDPSIPLLMVGDHPAPEADLSFGLASLGNGAINVAYYPAMYDTGTVHQICVHLGVLLQAGLADPATPIGRIDILDADERHLLLNDWNGKPIDYGDTLLLHRLFSRQAALTPDRSALEEEGRSISYAELEAASDCAARALTEAGIGQGDVVALTGRRSIDLFAAIMGIFKCGGTLAYFDETDTGARSARVATVAAPAVVVASADTPWHGPPTLPRLDLQQVVAKTEDRFSFSPVEIDPEQTAYLLFTSGSTGTPKAVMRSHRMCATRMLWEQNLYHLGTGERHLLKSPISFREFIWPLATGGTAVIARSGGEQDDAYLLRLVRDSNVSVISLVPSMLKVLVNSPGAEGVECLRHIFVGGEALLPGLERSLRSVFTADVHNTYTLTEADYVCTRPGPPPEDSVVTSNIGRPTDMRVYLCDTNLQLVPAGIRGEILTGGAGLSSGYAGRPDLTAERFVPDPFNPGTGLVFRTGDLARYRADGQLEYLGRIDHQIKVRGLRIEPGEIETALHEHPAIAQTAVLGWPDPDQGARVIAYFVPRYDPPSVDELRRFLNATLPTYMVPSAFVALSRLPTLPSGKLDRAALPPPGRHRPALETDYTPPRTDLERALAAMYSEVLQVEDVGVDDDFFILGGDSLRLLCLRALIIDRLCINVDLSVLLTVTTVWGLTQELQQWRSAAEGT